MAYEIDVYQAPWWVPTRDTWIAGVVDFEDATRVGGGFTAFDAAYDLLCAYDDRPEVEADIETLMGQVGTA